MSKSSSNLTVFFFVGFGGFLFPPGVLNICIFHKMSNLSRVGLKFGSIGLIWHNFMICKTNGNISLMLENKNVTFLSKIGAFLTKYCRISCFQPMLDCRFENLQKVRAKKISVFMYIICLINYIFLQQLWDLYPLVINWTEYPECGWCWCSFLPTSSMMEGESIDGFIFSFWSIQQPFQVCWRQDVPRVQDLTSYCLLSSGFWEKNDQRLPKFEFSTRQWDLSGAMCENFSRCILS